jgi:putative FmdB family regulatory protein
MVRGGLLRFLRRRRGMPLYDYRCGKCGRKEERFARVEEREFTCECGGYLARQLSLPTVRGMMQPYTSPIDGRWIEGERMRRDDLARSGCIPYDPEMKKDSERFREERRTEFERSVDRAVDLAAGELHI